MQLYSQASQELCAKEAEILEMSQSVSRTQMALDDAKKQIRQMGDELDHQRTVRHLAVMKAEGRHASMLKRNRDSEHKARALNQNLVEEHALRIQTEKQRDNLQQLIDGQKTSISIFRASKKNNVLQRVVQCTKYTQTRHDVSCKNAVSVSVQTLSPMIAASP